MAIERGEVEMLARVAVTEGASCRVTPDLLTELCRSYLAVLDAPVGKLVGSELNASNLVYHVALHGPKDGGPELLTLARLVPADGGE